MKRRMMVLAIVMIAVSSMLSASAETGKEKSTCRISFLVDAKHNFSTYEVPFVAGCAVRADTAFAPSLSGGFRAGYDLSSFLQLSAFIRCNFISSEKWRVYVIFGGGAAIGLGVNEGLKAVLGEASLGAEYRIYSQYSVFLEVLVHDADPQPGLEAGAAFGVSYAF